MSNILLYKHGTSTVVRGVTCDFVRCKSSEMNLYKEQGYVTNPQDLLEPTFEQVDTNKSGKLSNDEIRQAAKDTGIDGWESKQIKTLKKTLGL